MTDKYGKEYILLDGVLDVSVLEKVMCECGHPMGSHHYADGWCEKRCDCQKFKYKGE